MFICLYVYSSLHQIDILFLLPEIGFGTAARLPAPPWHRPPLSGEPLPRPRRSADSAERPGGPWRPWCHWDVWDMGIRSPRFSAKMEEDSFEVLQKNGNMMGIWRCPKAADKESMPILDGPLQCQYNLIINRVVESYLGTPPQFCDFNMLHHPW